MLMVTVRSLVGLISAQVVILRHLLRREYIDRGKVVLQMGGAERRLRYANLFCAALQVRQRDRVVCKAVV